MSPGLPALVTCQSDDPGCAFSTCTHRALVPSTAPAPPAALGSLRWTWANSDCDLALDVASSGRARPHATPATTERRVATTTSTTRLRCTTEGYRRGGWRPRHPGGAIRYRPV